jgi:tRNA A37 threonylcarbamoyladenosine dehydratase
LQNANILVVGPGGVGSLLQNFWPAGVGAMTIVDGDVVDYNINRQLPALHSTVGLPKITIVGQIDGY